MKFLIEAGSRSLIILVSVVISVYLLVLTAASGERVSVEERWFEYGQASTPKTAEDRKTSVAFSLLSPVEIDENESSFHWITEYGDVVAVSNLSKIPTQAILSLEVSNNPCRIERNLIIGTKSNQKIFKVPTKGSEFYTINIPLPAGSTEFLSLVPFPGDLCNLNNEDERNFVAKLSILNVSTN